MNNSALKTFIAEAEDRLSLIEADLSHLSINTKDIQYVNSLFRHAHSLKGAANLVGATPIEEISHKIEDLLEMLRSNKNVAETDTIIALLRFGFSRIKQFIESPHVLHFVDTKSDLEKFDIFLDKYR